MIYSYFHQITWFAICTLLTPTGTLVNVKENSIFDDKNFGCSNEINNISSNTKGGSGSVETNKRALQEIYLIREKKESEDPMNYLSKLYLDLEDSSKSPFQNSMAAMVDGIIDPPLIKLQFHNNVPNCGSNFNITKIIMLVDEDKKQRLCPCTEYKVPKPELNESEIVENKQADVLAAGAALPAPAAALPAPAETVSESQTQTQAQSNPYSEETACSTTEFSTELTTQFLVAQAGQLAVVSKAEIPGPKPAEAIKAPKRDQNKGAISMKKQDESKKTKTPPQRMGPQPSPPLKNCGPVSRITGGDTKKGSPIRPPAAAAASVAAPATRLSNGQMKNALRNTQQLANKPLHRKGETREGRGPPKGPVIPGHASQKQMKAKQPIANPDWDLAEPGAANPGLYPFRLT